MATTKVIKDLTEFNPGNPDYVLNATNPVTVINSGGNQYNFNGVYGKFGLRIGTTVLTGVPSGHPIAVLNNGLTGITYTGTVNEGTLAVGGVTYTFYSGDVTITVTTDFGVASYYCKIHGYMGGQDNLVSVYSEAGLRMPTGGAFSGTPAEGMMRNDDTQDSEGSISTMQHYTGDNVWKNFVNVALPPATFNIDFLVAAGAGGGSGGYSDGAGGIGGAGGGAGGLRISNNYAGGVESPITITIGTAYDVTVGAGGTASGTGFYSTGGDGADSVFSTITSLKGGRGGSRLGGTGNGGNGTYGSGGANSADSASENTTNAGTPGQGNDSGGTSQSGGTPATRASAGGGGAGSAGSKPTGSSGGNAGNSVTTTITGNSVTYAGGGGGGATTGGSGGTSNMTSGSTGGAASGSASAGTPNTGAGGGGGGGGNGGAGVGGSGGSGVVILRYPDASVSSFVVTGSLNTPTPIDPGGGDKVIIFTAGTGTITFS